MARGRMIDRGKRSVLGVGVDVVDYEGAVKRVMAAARSGTALGVSALAVHGVMTGALDPEHKYRLNRLALVTPDGQPVRWALRFLHGEKLRSRVYGPDLTLKVCEAAQTENIAVYLYGSRPEVLEAWKANLRFQYPNLRIAGTEPSKFRTLTAEEDIALNQRILLSGARIVFVGLGCPRQEVFAFEHTEALRMPVLAVGAAFDFHAGHLRQAPSWMQDRGLEWVFRLALEPQRLWRRYLLLNPLFCIMLAGQKLRLFAGHFEHQRPPKNASRFG